MSNDHADATRRLLQSERTGVLSTLQQARQPGFPMASLAPFALSARGEPIFAFSGLAQHTRNVLADPRACLYVQEGGAGNAQERARASVLGVVRLAREDEEPELRARYLSAHPEAERFFELDFSVYLLEVAEVRYIGGFGAASWVPASAVLGQP